jgi:DNA invertase Pin-like site-specific DNA recombinase
MGRGNTTHRQPTNREGRSTARRESSFESARQRRLLEQIRYHWKKRPAGCVIPAGLNTTALRGKAVMSRHHSTNGQPAKPAKAVAYYRMSTDKQEDSIERQRSQVVPYAARNGYHLVRDYTDEGIAGDEEKKRKDFMRMLADAQRREFDVILCDDKDRFGRFDSITQGYYVKPLRDAGVRLETVAQGRVDWSSFAGRITDAVLQEAKKIESQANSRRVISWMLQMAGNGKWLGGAPPYGYRLADDPKLGKRLVPGDAREVEAVRLMFRLYGQRGFTLAQVAEELYLRAIPPPELERKRKSPPRDPATAPTWERTTIRAILRNRKYVGDMVWNTGHDGKYSEVVAGIVNTSDQPIRLRTNNPLTDWIICRDTHDALVDRPLWERSQANLDANRTGARPGPNGDRGFLLSGLLVCGHCGWRMNGTTWNQKHAYKCGRYHQEGKRGCYCNSIGEARLFDCITRKLQEVVLNPANLQRRRDELRQQQEEVEAGRGPRLSGLRHTLAELEEKIAKGMDRMALIPPDLLTDFAANVRRWKEEHAKAEDELEKMLRPRERADFEETLREVEQDLSRLRDALLEEDARDVRAVLGEFVSRVELFWEHKQTSKMIRSKFVRGVIYIKPQKDLELADLFAPLCNGGSPIPAGSNGTR